MKLWLDVTISAPEGYVWAKTSEEGIRYIKVTLYHEKEVDLIDIGEGDYIEVLEWFSRRKYDIAVHIHSDNLVGVENMRRIIRRNGWEEI